MGVVYRRFAARRDLISHYVYLFENAGEAVVDRFLSNAEASFDELLRLPKIGVSLTLRRSELAGLRKWQVRDFENFLIFYQPRSSDIFIVRVMHVAQDWWSLFEFDA
jgi:toxin ParE1/3/4